MTHYRTPKALLLTLGVLLPGCASLNMQGRNGNNYEVQKEITEQEAIRIAKNEAQKMNFEYSKKKEFVEASLKDGHWYVVLIGEKPVLGNSIGFVISLDGQVIRIMPGM